MRWTTSRSILCPALVLALIGVGPAAKARVPTDRLTPFESNALAVLATLDRSDRAHPDSDIWPRYRFSERPLLVYFPGHWAVLFHAPHPLADFTAWPAGWPAASMRPVLHRGTFGGLVGQIAFNVPLDGAKVAAIPLVPAASSRAADSAAVACLALVAHEAFHQYQHDTFASIETGPEERYPIDDAGNAALLAVEMRALSAALLAPERGSWNSFRAMRAALEDFLAVRAYRWTRVGAQTVGLERQQELIEGTAKYVEARAIGLVAWQSVRDPADSLGRAIGARLSRISAAGYIRQELESRLQQGVIALEDLPLNRAHGLGAAQAILLDVLWSDWKRPAENSSDTFSYSALLLSAIGRRRPGAGGDLARALERHGYAGLLRASRARVREYRAAYRSAREEFEAQPGVRMQVSLPAGRLSRSHLSAARRWIVDRGTRSFGSHYVAYSLNDTASLGMRLSVRETGVLEEEDGSRRLTRVSLFTPALDSIVIDGQPMDHRRDGTRRFQRARLAGTTFSLAFDRPGTVRIDGRNVSVGPVGASQ